MKRKILGYILLSISFLTLFAGAISIQQSQAFGSTYAISIKVTKMKIWEDTDGGVNGYDKGELYMYDPGNDWTISETVKYRGYYYIGDLNMHTEKEYDITARGVEYNTLHLGDLYEIYDYNLRDKDYGVSQTLWGGYVKITGPTDGVVSGWAYDDVVVLAGGNVKLYTSFTLDYDWDWWYYGNPTPSLCHSHVWNKLFFEVNVRAI